MDRESIERLLLAHAGDLERAVEVVAPGSARELYREHLSCIRCQLARWRGGESERDLRAATSQQLIAYQSMTHPGEKAEAIGWSFGELCRVLGVKTASAVAGR